MHAYYAGDINVTPPEVLDFLKKNGFPAIAQVPPDEIKEVIADVLAIGMMIGSPYERFLHPRYAAMSTIHKQAFNRLFQKMLYRNYDDLKASA